jgi:mannose-1-phosphate guanylyltransferase/mannose-6-phosphate isomerase
MTDSSLLQETLLRLSGLQGLANPTLICNYRHRFIAAEQARSIDIQPRRIYLEPVGRNTAPAVAIAAMDIASTDPEALMLVLPSDHVVLNVGSFHKAVEDASLLAQEDYLVTFGIIPTAPKTGYGYIRQGQLLSGNQNAKGYRVAEFVEKPNLETAKYYLESGEYHWNSGMFVFKAAKYLEELQQHAPRIYEKSGAAYQSLRQEQDFAWLDQQAFSACPEDSIDYAIMEKTRHAAVIPVDIGWSDIGSWGALWEMVGKDAKGNAANGHVYMKDVSNCYIKSNKEIVAALGIDGLIIIDTQDALLIAHMDKEQEVKDVFKKLM